jgi:hypothetical protein
MRHRLPSFAEESEKRFGMSKLSDEEYEPSRQGNKVTNRKRREVETGYRRGIGLHS